MTDPTHKEDAQIDKARCQAMTMFRPVYGTYGGLMGDVRDRMRCTNQARVLVQDVHLCGIHSFDDRNIQRAIRSAWK